MKKLQWLVITAGIVALAACSDRDEANTTNVGVSAQAENVTLPPAETTPEMNAVMNADANADTNAVDNTTNNTAANTTNAY